MEQIPAAASNSYTERLEVTPEEYLVLRAALQFRFEHFENENDPELRQLFDALTQDTSQEGVVKLHVANPETQDVSTVAETLADVLGSYASDLYWGRQIMMDPMDLPEPEGTDGLTIDQKIALAADMAEELDEGMDSVEFYVKLEEGYWLNGYGS